MTQCLALFIDHPNVEALGINCTPPQFIPGLLKTIDALRRDKKLLVYPNSGEVYHADSKTWSGESSPHDCKTMAREWISLGADIIGGCCQIGPKYIQALCNLKTDST